MAIRDVIFLLTILSFISTHDSTREFPSPPPIRGLDPTGPKGPAFGGGALDCLTSLSTIRSCSNEIAAYFSNGTIDITLPCCEAINLITHRCWSAILGVLGYGPDQTNILRGYCDATVSYADGLGPVSSPLGQPTAAANYIGG